MALQLHNHQSYSCKPTIATTAWQWRCSYTTITLTAASRLLSYLFLCCLYTEGSTIFTLWEIRWKVIVLLTVHGQNIISYSNVISQSSLPSLSCFLLLFLRLVFLSSYILYLIFLILLMKCLFYNFTPSTSFFHALIIHPLSRLYLLLFQFLFLLWTSPFLLIVNILASAGVRNISVCYWLNVYIVLQTASQSFSKSVRNLFMHRTVMIRWKYWL
jgi:hypothetical protein